MSSEIPTWLTKEFIKNALEVGNVTPNQESITIDCIEVDKPVPKGDNYACDISRVKVVYRRPNMEETPRNTSLIIKAPLTGGLHVTILELGMPQKEVNMYKKYLPKLNKLLGDSGAIAAKSFYSSQENVLVLEDLKFKGYVTADRRRQLDYDHCVVALKTLAVFHAASVKLHVDDPELVEEVGEEIFFSEKANSSMADVVNSPFKLMAKECRQIPELSRYSDQLLAYSENSWETLIEMMKPKENGFNVLNHGDFWVNNMLFRYENGNPVGLNLVDFQICRFTSPSYDLHYFFYSSVQDEVRLKRKDDLLNAYLTELNLNLEKFGATQRLKESELVQMLDMYDFLGLFISLWVYPIVIGDPKDGIMDLTKTNPEQLKDTDNNPFGLYYKNKVFLKMAEKRLAEFEQRGWF